MRLCEGLVSAFFWGKADPMKCFRMPSHLLETNWLPLGHTQPRRKGIHPPSIARSPMASVLVESSRVELKPERGHSGTNKKRQRLLCTHFLAHREKWGDGVCCAQVSPTPPVLTHSAATLRTIASDTMPQPGGAAPTGERRQGLGAACQLCRSNPFEVR